MSTLTACSPKQRNDLQACGYDFYVGSRSSGKELDQDGPLHSIISLDFTITGFPATIASGDYCRLTAQFTDGSTEVRDFSFVDAGSGAKKAVLKGFLKSPGDRTIKYLHLGSNVTGCIIDYWYGSTETPCTAMPVAHVGKELDIMFPNWNPVSATSIASRYPTCDPGVFQVEPEHDPPQQVAGSNLYYFGARYYDPEIGIWTSTDPDCQFFDAYSYCGADPVNGIDLDGTKEYPANFVGPLQLGDWHAGNIAELLRAMGYSIGELVSGSLSGVKYALRQVKGVLGDKNLPKGEPGKWGAPQRGNSVKGYRLDPGHGAGAPANERGPHLNYWDYTQGKRGNGGIKGAIPIPAFVPEFPVIIIPLPLLQQMSHEPPPEG